MACYAKDERANNKTFDCIPTIAEGIRAANKNGKTVNLIGVDINSARSDGIQAALAASQAADAVILVLGIDHSIEYEGADRKDINLPGLQESFALKILALNKPTLLILVNGGVLGIDALVAGPQAIIEAFYPSVQGARALANSIFGVENRWGKLPVTMYPAAYVNEVSIIDFDMSKHPGRTYRYYSGKPLWPFGYGMSLTTFNLSCTSNNYRASQKRGAVALSYQCIVKNIGNYDGDEVVMVYHQAGSDIRKKVTHPVPIKQLVDFQRVTVKKAGTQTITFSLDDTAVQLTDQNGDKLVYPGTHYIAFSRGLGEDVVFTVAIN